MAECYSDVEVLAQAEKILLPVTLPCGRVVPNRLFKAPMYEHLSPMWGGFTPHDGFVALYEQWAKAGWGMIVTGNVQVAKDHLPLGRDLTVPDTLDEETLGTWRHLADAIHYGSPNRSNSTKPESRPLAVMQLSHGGRQSLNFLGGRPLFARPLGPSPVRVGQMHGGKDGWFSRLAHWLALQVPREMTHADIQHAISQFVQGARLAAQSGFDGIELHAAHGYLISQFISPKTNHRTDEYAADQDSLRFLREIVFAIRAPGVVPEDFVVGLKLNSSDYARDTYAQREDLALNHVREIGKWGLVDYIQVSGGDYEDPQFVDRAVQFKSPRQSLFETFAEQSIEILAECVPTVTNRPPPLVVLTGGINTLPRMSSALAHDHAHLLGVARLAIHRPSLPLEIAKAIETGNTGSLMSPPRCPTELGDAPQSHFSLRALERLTLCILRFIWRFVPARLPRIIGTSADILWYEIMLRRIAIGKDVDYTMGTIGAVVRFLLPGTPLSSTTGNEGWTWWVAAACVGVILGIGIGQFV